MKINAIIDDSTSDGPGIRTVIFFQGCSKKCPECHNFETWNKDKGKIYTIETLYNEIEERAENKRITFSGGEPMEQYEELKVLSEILYKEGFELCLYTGWELDEISIEILNYLKYIKVGEYRAQERILKEKYYGSENQKFYIVERKEGKVCLKEI